MLGLTNKIDFSGRSSDAVSGITGIAKKRVMAPVRGIFNALKGFAEPFWNDAFKGSIADVLKVVSVVAPGGAMRSGIKAIPEKIGL